MTYSRRTLALVVTAVVAGAALLVLATVALLPPRTVAPTAPDGPPPPGFALPVDPPLAAENPRGGVAGLVDEDWLATVSDATGIPARALSAYAGAAIAKANQMPGCGLGWTTLAAIGLSESDHGRHGGSRVGEDGTVTPPIYGVALDGAATAHIPDSDNGEFDGDAEFDRAIGPMQLIPEAWRNWHIDANGDGIEDPQNIDDAVTAAANYLCRASGDMLGEKGWRTGIAAYNRSGEYRQAVADAANRYAASME